MTYDQISQKQDYKRLRFEYQDTLLNLASTLAMALLECKEGPIKSRIRNDLEKIEEIHIRLQLEDDL